LQKIRTKFSLVAGLLTLMVFFLATIGAILSKLLFVTMLSGFAGIILTAVLFFLYAKKTANKMNKFNEAGDQHIKGNITVPLCMRTGDEIESLSCNTEQATKGLIGCLSIVRQHNEKLIDSSSQIFASIEQISKGSQEQAGQISELLEKITSLAEKSRHWSNRANSTADLCDKVDDSAMIGKDMLANLKKGMELIKERTASLETNLIQINQITNVINDIADQTNLLALNAAIESARAGEQGLGFSVVSDEVRNLAGNSVEGTKEIINLVSYIQAETQNAVQAVNSGIGLSEHVGQAFSNVVGYVSETKEVADKLSELAEKQASTIEEMVINTQIMNDHVQQRASLSETAVSKSQEFNSINKKLDKMIKLFNF